MFENLIESKKGKSKSFGQQVVSLVLHLVIGYAAVKATAGAAETMKAIIQDTTMVFLKPPEPPPPPKVEIPPEAIVTANPPPMGFQTVMPPTEIPKEIPPVNLSERFNAADFSGKRIEIIVPFTEGGGADSWARMVMPHLAKKLQAGRVRG